MPRVLPPCEAPPNLTVWYDGACPLCSREIAILKRLDKGRMIDFIDASDETSECPLDRSAMLQRLHAEEGGDLLSGAAAFAAMWRAIPLLRPIGIFASKPPMIDILDALYGLFLRIRPRLIRMMKKRG